MSSILFDPAELLYTHTQDGRPIDEYVEEFIGLSHLVPWSDVLKTLFWLGLDDNLVGQVPTAVMSGSLAQYVDCVMLLCSSSLTVGEVDEDLRDVSPVPPVGWGIAPAHPEPPPESSTSLVSSLHITSGLISIPSGPSSKSSFIMATDSKSAPVYEPGPKRGKNSEINNTSALLFTSAQRRRRRRKKWASADPAPDYHPVPFLTQEFTPEFAPVSAPAREFVPVPESRSEFTPVLESSNESAPVSAPAPESAPVSALAPESAPFTKFRIHYSPN